MRVIQAYVERKYGFKVHTAYIAKVKRSLAYQWMMHQTQLMN